MTAGEAKPGFQDREEVRRFLAGIVRGLAGLPKGEVRSFRFRKAGVSEGFVLALQEICQATTDVEAIGNLSLTTDIGGGMDAWAQQSANEIRAKIVHLARTVKREMGLSQSQFAARVGVPQSTLFRWVKGKATPNVMHLHVMNDVAAAAGIATDLFGRTEEFPEVTAFRIHRDGSDVEIDISGQGLERLQAHLRRSPR